MNKNFIRHILLLSTLFSIFVVNVHFLYAAKTDSDIEQDYADTADIFKPRCTASSCIFTFIAPIPIVGMNLSENNKTIDITGGKGVADYVAAVYKTLIAGIAAVALVYMVYGAAMYASTDALFKKAEGKTAFKNALAGLGLALVSYTILATLNPFLLSTNFNPANISVDANPTQDGTTGTGGTGGGAVTPVPGGGGTATNNGSYPSSQTEYLNSLSNGSRGTDGRLTISSYGYPDDLTPDSGTQARRGNHDNLLTPGSVALSPDLVQRYNPQHGASVYVNGKLVGYYDDSTPSSYNGQSIENTIDIYDPQKIYGGNNFMRGIPPNQWDMTFGEVRPSVSNPSN